MANVAVEYYRSGMSNKSPMTRRGFCLLGGAAALLPAVGIGADGPDAGEDEMRSVSALTTERWNFFKDSYWYVPAANLRAYIYTPGSQEVTFATDQTVIHITDYRRGYFWGVTGVQLGDGNISYRSLVGSVTPAGSVYLAFTPFDAGRNATVTQGFGEMQKKLGQWTMVNQMSSGPGAQLSMFHWAYMLQTKPGRRTWDSLPGSGLSVPEFLQDCPPGPELRRA